MRFVAIQAMLAVYRKARDVYSVPTSISQPQLLARTVGPRILVAKGSILARPPIPLLHHNDKMLSVLVKGLVDCSQRTPRRVQ